jgi:MarR family transcriptional regulator, 2-MHQ and catechol-resistance regulon repressor
MQNKKSCAANGLKYQADSLPEVFQLVGELAKKLNRIESQALRADHLTPPQYVILTLLCERDEQPLKNLAERLSCTRATVTGIIDTMEKKGLVRRVACPGDRRSMLVQLCAQGHELVRTTPGMQKAFSGCCDILAPEETSQLARLLAKLNTELNF